jgi:hypothetical protein
VNLSGFGLFSCKQHNARDVAGLSIVRRLQNHVFCLGWCSSCAERSYTKHHVLQPVAGTCPAQHRPYIWLLNNFGLLARSWGDILSLLSWSNTASSIKGYSPCTRVASGLQPILLFLSVVGAYRTVCCECQCLYSLHNMWRLRPQEWPVPIVKKMAKFCSLLFLGGFPEGMDREGDLTIIWPIAG